MRRLLDWLLGFWPKDPNLDRRDDWEPRPVVWEPTCGVCTQPPVRDGLCGEHAELPFTEWSAETQTLFLDDLRRGGPR
jgi:hypothetical protein